LEERGFDPDHLQETWHLQGIGISDQLSWRIFIPIRFRGKTVSWTTRSIDPHASLRYIAAGEGEERIPRGSLLYGEDYCTSSVIVHEGPSDVWATGPGAVATLGLSYTQEQVIRISRFPRRIVCFDNEPDAQERADKLCRNLRFYSGTTINFRFDEEGTDAGSAGDREINQLRKLLDG
jgi:hypothetical protein